MCQLSEHSHSVKVVLHVSRVARILVLAIPRYILWKLPLTFQIVLPCEDLVSDESTLLLVHFPDHWSTLSHHN